MQHLVGDTLSDESWEEYADHSLTHDDVKVENEQQDCEAVSSNRNQS